MAAGALDSNGIWMFGEDDERDTFSELLNIGQDSTSDAIGADRARLAALEAAGALGATTNGILVPASGWTLTTARGRKKNGTAWVEVIFTRSGGNITVPADGNITNQSVATFNSGWVPVSGMNFVATTANTGTAAAGQFSSGGVSLSAVPPGTTVNTGDQFSLAGHYPLA